MANHLRCFSVRTLRCLSNQRHVFSVATQLHILHLVGVDVHDRGETLHEVLVHLVHGVGPAAARA